MSLSVPPDHRDRPAQAAGSPDETLEDEFSWSEFSGTNSPAVFARLWLKQVRDGLPELQSAVVMMLRKETGKLVAAGHWPLDVPVDVGLDAAVDAAVKRQQAVILPRVGSEGNAASQLCYPVSLSGQLVALVAIQVPEATSPELENSMRTLRWQSAWLELFYQRRRETPGELEHSGLVGVMSLLAVALEEVEVNAACMAVANELAGHFRCARASLGLTKKGYCRIVATSGVADFAEKATLLRVIGCAMDEAVDQQLSVLYPVPDGVGTVLLNKAQQTLAELDADLPQTVCSVPLPGTGRYIGALTLERSVADPFSEDELELVELAAALLGPVIEEKQNAARSWWQVARDSLTEHTRRLFGPRYYGRKALVSVVGLFLLIIGVFPGTYRVTADARLESTILRAVVAPVDGYVESAEVRAGDLLREGDALYALDDRDLKLEQLRWSSEKTQLQGQLRDALADRERSRVRVIEAQLAQADAQLLLVTEQLTRMHGKAPFDGHVITGDLSQSLGAPVSRGDVLFEIAPLDAYRVILLVNERDIDDIALRQTGNVVLRSGSESALGFEVERIIPMAEAYEGANIFRVEGRLDSLPQYLRPGMEGVGKIEAGKRSLLWIWTHRFTDWLRLVLWEWF